MSQPEAHPRAGAFIDFEDFFRHYTGNHSRALTRWTHFAGLHLAIVGTVAAAVLRRPEILAAAIAVGFIPGWLTHLFLERRLPSLFGKPVWSIRADISMILLMWQGRDGQLARMAQANVSARQRNPTPPSA